MYRRILVVDDAIKKLVLSHKDSGEITKEGGKAGNKGFVGGRTRLRSEG